MFRPRASHDRGVRTVKGTKVQTVELIWADGHSEYEVIQVASTDREEVLLTDDGLFPSFPTTGQIEALLSHHSARRLALN
jgi:hypothetical protein